MGQFQEKNEKLLLGHLKLLLGHFLNTHFRKFEAIVNKLHKTVRNDFINLYDKEQNSLRTLSSSKFFHQNYNVRRFYLLAFHISKSLKRIKK